MTLPRLTEQDCQRRYLLVLTCSNEEEELRAIIHEHAARTKERLLKLVEEERGLWKTAPGERIRL